MKIKIEEPESIENKDVNTCQHSWFDFQFEDGHLEAPHVMLACEYCGLVKVKK